METQSLARFINRLILFVTRHWLALASGVLAAVLGLAFLAPWLMLHGFAGAGTLLYLAYQPMCHQLPERSFFLGGPQPWYTLAELSQHLGYEAPPRFIGDPELGYKVAFCERDTSIYAGWLLGGIVFGLFRRRFRSLPWQGLLLLSLPMGVDGLVQLFGILESTWMRRTVTGLLFGLAVIWFAYPLLERGMNEAHEIAKSSLEESDAGAR